MAQQVEMVLQWSRVRMNAEGTPGTAGDASITLLQWSRVRMNAEGAASIHAGIDSTSLQWSRVRMNAKGPPKEQRRRRGQQASMEPRSDERGRATCGGWLRRALRGFNGAAFG